ncbi:MAG: hypothetical protein V1872_14680 [bacterium]
MKQKKEKKTKEYKSYTAWHIFLADVMDYLLDPKDLEVYPFEKLGSLPLESDFILISKKEIGDLNRLYPDFVFMLPYLGRYTVIEYKSPGDTLRFKDFDKTRAYWALIKGKYGLVYDKDIHIISMASRFQKGYEQYIKDNGYQFQELDKGICGHTDNYHHFYWIDLKVIGHEDPKSFVNLFSSNYKEYAKSNKYVEIRHFEVLSYICQNIFKKEIHMTNTEIRQLPEFIESMELIKKKFWESIPAEERLAGLKPEERVKGLEPEERLKGLKPEERLKGLKPEERLKGLEPEERLKGLEAEERLKGLKPEELKKLKKILSKL